MKLDLSMLREHVYTLFLRYHLVNNLVVIKLMQKKDQQEVLQKKIELIKFINFSIQIKTLLL